MAALVPYARMALRNPYTTKTGYLAYLRARRASRIIGGAYRAYRATKMFRRIKRRVAQYGGNAFKRRRIGARSRIADPVGKSTAKRNQNVTDTLRNWTTNTQYTEDLTNLGQTTTNEINYRQRGIVNIRGFKLCMSVKNNGNTPIYLNVAVLGSKANPGIINQEFFRSNDNERAVNYNDVNLTDLDRHCRAINTDRWLIFWHRRFMLGCVDQVGGDYNDKRQSYMKLEKYVKIGRQFRYSEGTTDSIPENGECKLVYWFGTFNGTGSAVVDAASGELRNVVYFREPRA